jgi:hypothetical protein
MIKQDKYLLPLFMLMDYQAVLSPTFDFLTDSDSVASFAVLMVQNVDPYFIAAFPLELDNQAQRQFGLLGRHRIP